MIEQQAYRNPPWKREVKLLGKIGAFLVLAFVISLIYLHYSAQLSEVRLKIQQAHTRRNDLMRQIAEYQTRSGALTAYPTMRQRAAQLGYVDIDFYNDAEFLYLELDGFDPDGALKHMDSFTPMTIPVSPLRPEYTISLQTFLEQRTQRGQQRRSE